MNRNYIIFTVLIISIVAVSAVWYFSSSKSAEGIDGATLYSSRCSSCHGPLSTSEKLNHSAQEIQEAINTVEPMKAQLSDLTSEQIQAIANALAKP